MSEKKILIIIQNKITIRAYWRWQQYWNLDISLS